MCEPEERLPVPITMRCEGCEGMIESHHSGVLLPHVAPARDGMWFAVLMAWHRDCFFDALGIDPCAG